MAKCLLVCLSLQGQAVEPQTLLDVSGAVPESVTSSVLEACHNRGFAGIQDAITDAIASGWGVSMSLLLSAPDISCFLVVPLKLGVPRRARLRVHMHKGPALARWSGLPDMRMWVINVQAQQLLLELQAGILRDTKLQDKQRARICTALAEADKCLVDGSDEFLQLLHVASVAQLAIQGTA